MVQRIRQHQAKAQQQVGKQDPDKQHSIAAKILQDDPHAKPREERQQLRQRQGMPAPAAAA